jgi:hypothetical protein
MDLQGTLGSARTVRSRHGSFRDRASDIATQTKDLGRRGRLTLGDAARLFRDVAAERPILVIGTLAIVTYVLLRYGSLRSAGAVVQIAGQAATLAGEAGGV